MKISDAAQLLNISGELTKEIIKKAYRKASFEFHPDRNPAGLEMMKAINEAYATLKDYEGTVEASQGDYSAELNEALNKIIGLAGIEIEICGAWVWVTGDTKPHAKMLGRKEGGAGFYYASKKKAWYYRPSDWKSKSRGNWSLNEIRTEHGSQSVKNTQRAISA